VDLEDIEDVGIARGDRYYKEALRSSPRVHEGVIRGRQGKSGRITLLVGVLCALLSSRGILPIPAPSLPVRSQPRGSQGR
jgi:hypothetical protein